MKLRPSDDEEEDMCDEPEEDESCTRGVKFAFLFSIVEHLCTYSLIKKNMNISKLQIERSRSNKI